MTTTAASEPHRTVRLDQIDAPANVRQLDREHVQALAGSIAIQGVVVPLVVRPAEPHSDAGLVTHE